MLSFEVNKRVLSLLVFFCWRFFNAQDLFERSKKHKEWTHFTYFGSSIQKNHISETGCNRVTLFTSYSALENFYGLDVLKLISNFMRRTLSVKWPPFFSFRHFITKFSKLFSTTISNRNINSFKLFDDTDILSFSQTHWPGLRRIGWFTNLSIKWVKWRPGRLGKIKLQ